MRNLINFLIQYSVVFLFLLLEIISFTLVVKNQDYQRSVFLSSSNSVVSGLYQVSNSVVEFFKLSAANESLSEENTALKNEIILLQNQLSALSPELTDSLNYKIPAEMDYRLISAKVINNSTNKLQNYITLNKGARDGVQPDMGVISEEGVVGIVKTVSERFSVVIPVLNQNIKINSKFKKNNYSGPLVWKGRDYRYASLSDIARHVEFSLGDTLITSGFTNTFPEGIPVGIINDFNIKESDPYYNIEVKLAVNFRTLSHVKVINYLNYNEQRSLENEALK
ncbi:MAG: rod shape-determining protein MreC [Paludibacteraceae bacterium]|nr:rod shape-determining protein MreC [Paludibacteraceae bacterium]